MRRWGGTSDSALLWLNPTQLRNACALAVMLVVHLSFCAELCFAAADDGCSATLAMPCLFCRCRMMSPWRRSSHACSSAANRCK